PYSFFFRAIARSALSRHSERCTALCHRCPRMECTCAGPSVPFACVLLGTPRDGLCVARDRLASAFRNRLERWDARRRDAPVCENAQLRRICFRLGLGRCLSSSRQTLLPEAPRG